MIDLPQVVDVIAHPNGRGFLDRDAKNVATWFARAGHPDADPEVLARLLAEEARLELADDRENPGRSRGCRPYEIAGRILVEPGAGSSGFHVADELVFQSVPGRVRGSPNRGITLASKPVTAVMRSPAIVTTSSP